VARVKNDEFDDLWADPAQFEDLPRSATELTLLKRSLSRARSATTFRPAWEGTIPKRDGLTRTGHFLYPLERVYYQALVDSILATTEVSMAPRTHVFGYRVTAARTSSAPFGKRPIEQWLQFHRTVKEAVKSRSFQAVVISDIAAFFEMIPHAELERQLVLAGVRPATAAELRRALGTIMGSERGIPQGSDTSSALASAFLFGVDRAMLRSGYAYFRYVDDLRILVGSESEGRRALRQLEAEVRRLGLSLQPGKTEILVGSAQLATRILNADAEIDGIDYVWRGKPRRLSLPRIKKAWRSESRRKAWNKRLIKYLINRLRKSKDALALNWCLRRLGVLDWLAELVAPYLALFPDRMSVQRAVEVHLRSDANLSGWEASALLRMLLSARRVSRGILDFAVGTIEDANAQLPVRQWSTILLGKAGNAADRVVVARHSLDHELVARAAVVALQDDVTLRGTTYAAIGQTYPALQPLIHRYRGLARSRWPVYPTW
jgi:hypothetical protein